MMWWDGNGHGDGWGAGAWFAMGLLMLIFWVLVAALVIWLVRSSREHRPPVDVSKPQPGADRGHAEAVLAERFARGEIDEAEYTRRREVLRGAAGQQN